MKGRHVQATRLEQVTAETVSHFISRRVREDGIAPKTANRIREVLHVLFAHAIKEKGYHGRLALFAQADQAQQPALGRDGGAPRKARAARILLTG